MTEYLVSVGGSGKSEVQNRINTEGSLPKGFVGVWGLDSPIVLRWSLLKTPVIHFNTYILYLVLWLMYLQILDGREY